MQYGLVGETLRHSFSKQIHAMLGGYTYDLVERGPEAFDVFMLKKDFKGINVTIPYKERVMAFCDEIDPVAQAIGAVNTVVNRAGHLIGYNTDAEGFCAAAHRYGVSFAGKRILLLGNGASAKTVRAAAKNMGAAGVLVASRQAGEGLLSYTQVAGRADVEVLVNCSPVGMYPGNGASLIDLASLPRLRAVFDLVYNPFKTKLLLQAEKLGLPAVNGLYMLVAQAKAAAEIFTESAIPDERCETIRKSLVEKLANLSLIGMPGSGKSTLGRLLAERLHKRFVDLDELIEETAGVPVPEIFADSGEEVFRQMEGEAAERAGRETGQVIATGGGAPLREENREALRQNGVLLYIDCPLERLSMSDGRPLAKTREDLAKLFVQREAVYRAAADAAVRYRPTIEAGVDALEEAYFRLAALL